jgi:uncharacterized membrane protein YhaH (DUF805 family)
MTLSDYFLSPHGRIGRQEYWLGMLAMMAVTLAGAALIDPEGFTSAGGKVRPPSFAATVWSLFFAWPTTAVSIKRFNDRDWPWWLGYALGASMAAFVIANYHGYFLDPDGMAPVERLLMASAAVAFLWALFENGFQKGTSGPNRYGADPLGQPVD